MFRRSKRSLAGGIGSLLFIISCTQAMNPEKPLKSDEPQNLPPLECRALLAPDPDFFDSGYHPQLIGQLEEEEQQKSRRTLGSKQYYEWKLAVAFVGLEKAVRDGNFDELQRHFQDANGYTRELAGGDRNEEDEKLSRDIAESKRRSDRLLRDMDAEIRRLGCSSEELQPEPAQVEHRPERSYYRFPRNILFRTENAQLARFILERAPERIQDQDNGYTLMHAALASWAQPELVTIYGRYPECSPFSLSPHGVTPLHIIGSECYQRGLKVPLGNFHEKYLEEKFDRLMALVKQMAAHKEEAVKARLRLINAKVQLSSGALMRTVGWNVFDFIKDAYDCMNEPLTRENAPLYFYMADEKSQLLLNLIDIYARKNQHRQSSSASPALAEKNGPRLGMPLPLDENERECPVCLDDIEAGNFTPVRCYHKFHPHCLERLFKKDQHFPCPVCARPLVKVSDMVTPGEGNEKSDECAGQHVLASPAEGPNMAALSRDDEWMDSRPYIPSPASRMPASPPVSEDRVHLPDPGFFDVAIYQEEVIRQAKAEKQRFLREELGSPTFTDRLHLCLTEITLEQAVAQNDVKALEENFFCCNIASRNLAGFPYEVLEKMEESPDASAEARRRRSQIYYHFPRNILFRTSSPEIARFVVERAPERLRDQRDGYTLLHAALASIDIPAEVVTVYGAHEDSFARVSPHGMTPLHMIGFEYFQKSSKISIEREDILIEKFDRLMTLVREKAATKKEGISAQLALIDAKVLAADGVPHEIVGSDAFDFMRIGYDRMGESIEFAPLYRHIAEKREQLYAELIEIQKQNESSVQTQSSGT